MSEEFQETLGNAAAMREALVALRDAARNFYHQILNSKYNDIMDTYKCRERGFPALLDLRYAIPKANVALAAPARNCDLPNTTERYNEFCYNHRDAETRCGKCPFNGSSDCEAAWLLASAEKGSAE